MISIQFSTKNVYSILVIPNQRFHNKKISIATLMSLESI